MEFIRVRVNDDGKKLMKSFDSIEEAPDYTHVMLTRDEWDYFCKQVNDMKEHHKENMSLTSSKVDSLNSEVEVLRQQNENLMRICKERANADRNIHPKKLNRGYILLGMRQQDSYFGKKRYSTIKATIQLPCNVHFKHDAVINYLKKDNWGEYIFALVENPYMCTDTIPYDANEYDVLIYDVKYNMNYRSGYWEADLYLDRFIDFPEMMKCKD